MSSDREVGTLAELIERLSSDAARLDEAFARRLAAGLHARAAHVELPEIEALGFEDVVATFTMDRELHLVVTGRVGQSGGEGSVRWREDSFGEIPVAVHREPRSAPYVFATLDFSVRGCEGELLAAASPLPAGVVVRVRCLATIGERSEYRVRGHGVEVSVPRDELRLRSDED